MMQIMGACRSLRAISILDENIFRRLSNVCISWIGEIAWRINAPSILLDWLEYWILCVSKAFFYPFIRVPDMFPGTMLIMPMHYSVHDKTPRPNDASGSNDTMRHVHHLSDGLVDGAFDPLFDQIQMPFRDMDVSELMDPADLDFLNVPLNGSSQLPHL